MTGVQTCALPISNDILEKLSEKYSFDVWKKIDENNTAVRVCTSWATKEENVDELISDIEKI